MHKEYVQKIDPFEFPQVYQIISRRLEELLENMKWKPDIVNRIYLQPKINYKEQTIVGILRILKREVFNQKNGISPRDAFHFRFGIRCNHSLFDTGIL